MKILMFCGILITVVLCRSAAQTIPEEFRVRPGKVVSDTGWPGDFERVVAVTYDFEEDKLDDVVIDGKLHKGVFMTSQKLTPSQIKKLYSAITGEHTHLKPAVCFEPHHGLVFYDAKNEIVGSITMCFGCGSYRHSPKGEVSKVFDLQALKDLILDLEMPVLSKSKYKALYNEYKQQNKAEEPTPKPPSD